jgi:haloalkane dehalogenase
MSDAFLAWQRYSQEAPDFPVGRIVSNGCATPLPPEVVAAYDAPFPDDAYKAGARAFPALVPTRPDDPAAAANRAAWQVLRRWDGRSSPRFRTPTPSPGAATRRSRSWCRGRPAGST